MNDSSLVSIYMPTQNRPDMAIRAIKSVLQQTYQSIEIVVCDDGSTPGVNEELEKLLLDNGHVYIRNEKPEGACAARNRAISLCTGQYVTGIDDDDEMHPERINTLLTAFDERVAFVASSYLEISSKGKIPRQFDHGRISHGELLHYNKVGNQVFTLRNRFLEVGLFDEQLPAMQDYDMWIRLCKTYGTAIKLADCVYLLHTEHEENRISTNPQKLLDALTILREKHSGDYTRAHWQSSYILETKIKNEDLTLINFIKWVNTKNLRLALAYMLKRWR